MFQLWDPVKNCTHLVTFHCPDFNFESSDCCSSDLNENIFVATFDILEIKSSWIQLVDRGLGAKNDQKEGRRTIQQETCHTLSFVQ